MIVLFSVLFTLLMVLVIAAGVAYFTVSPWFGLAIPVLFALAVLVEFLERKYKKAAGIPTLFERAMQLKNEENSSSGALEK